MIEYHDTVAALSVSDSLGLAAFEMFSDMEWPENTESTGAVAPPTK